MNNQHSPSKHLPGYTGYRPQYMEERNNFVLPQMEKQLGRVPGKYNITPKKIPQCILRIPVM